MTRDDLRNIEDVADERADDGQAELAALRLQLKQAQEVIERLPIWERELVNLQNYLWKLAGPGAKMARRAAEYLEKDVHRAIAAAAPPPVAPPAEAENG